MMEESDDSKAWQEIRRADSVKPQWDIPVTALRTGAEVPGRKARYLRLELRTAEPLPLHLRQVEVGQRRQVMTLIDILS